MKTKLTVTFAVFSIQEAMQLQTHLMAYARRSVLKNGEVDSELASNLASAINNAQAVIVATETYMSQTRLILFNEIVRLQNIHAPSSSLVAIVIDAQIRALNWAIDVITRNEITGAPIQPNNYLGLEDGN